MTIPTHLLALERDHGIHTRGAERRYQRRNRRDDDHDDHDDHDHSSDNHVPRRNALLDQTARRDADRKAKDAANDAKLHAVPEEQRHHLLGPRA